MYLHRVHNPGISTHTLREEGDICGLWLSLELIGFQPTPSARRVTRRQLALAVFLGFQPTPSARRVTVPLGGGFNFGFNISTHTLREEGDLVVFRQVAGDANFNPHPPRGG